MRLASRLSLGALCLGTLLAACDDDITAPRLAPLYTLVQVDGAALPAPQGPGPDDYTVLAGSLHFRTDGRVARALTTRSPGGVEETFRDTVAYGTRKGRVWMLRLPTAVNDTVWGTLDGNSFEWASVSTRYRYRADGLIAPTSAR